MSNKSAEMNEEGRKEYHPVIIGEAYNKVKILVKQYAKNDRSILLIGQRGIGKELLAQYYMDENKRKGNSMTVNCAAFPDTMLRSELFGHVKGAFTDAVKDRPGKLKICDKGILFLDELGDASPEFQAAILRVAERNSFFQLGKDEEEEEVDTLLIAATNRPGKLTSDLKDRFNPIYVPPLQKGDILPLATHFFQQLAGRKDGFLKEEIIDELISREYPGNVRELKRVCEQKFSEINGAVFAKERPQLTYNDSPFNYSRFCREYEFWQEYIKPIIQKAEPTFHVSYAYQLDFNADDLYFLNDPYGFEEEAYRSIESFKSTFEEKSNCINFAKLLHKYIENGKLSSFILHLGFRLGIELGKPSISNTTFNTTPNLSPLLDITEPEHALKEFKRYYYQYHLQRNNGDREKTAEYLGMTPNALYQRLGRL